MRGQRGVPKVCQRPIRGAAIRTGAQGSSPQTDRGRVADGADMRRAVEGGADLVVHDPGARLRAAPRRCRADARPSSRATGSARHRRCRCSATLGKAGGKLRRWRVEEENRGKARENSSTSITAAAPVKSSPYQASMGASVGEGSRHGPRTASVLRRGPGCRARLVRNGMPAIAASQASRIERTPRRRPVGMRHDPAARRVDQVGPSQRGPGHMDLPRGLAGREDRHGDRRDARPTAACSSARAEAITLSSLSQNLLARPLTCSGPPRPAARRLRPGAVVDSQAPGAARGSPSRCGGRGSAGAAWRRRASMPVSPTEFRLAITQVPPSACDKVVAARASRRPRRSG